MPTAGKTCCVCGTDLSRQKRVKDLTGRYYCHGCWSSQSAKAGAEHAARQAQIQALEELEPTGHTDGHKPLGTCRVCKGVMWMERMRISPRGCICRDCFRRRMIHAVIWPAVVIILALAAWRLAKSDLWKSLVTDPMEQPERK